MRKLFVAGAIAVAMVMAPAAAMAVPFTGQVDYTGTHSADNANLTLATMTTILNTPVSPQVASVSGSFVTAGMVVGELLTHWSPIVFRPAGTPYAPLWTSVSGVEFDLLTLSIVSDTPNQLGLNGTGFFRCEAPCVGFETTPGVWNMTLNTQGQVNGSFSSSSTAVPEPGLLALLGLGLLGVARKYRR